MTREQEQKEGFPKGRFRGEEKGGDGNLSVVLSVKASTRGGGGGWRNNSDDNTRARTRAESRARTNAAPACLPLFHICLAPSLYIYSIFPLPLPPPTRVVRVTASEVGGHGFDQQ